MNEPTTNPIEMTISLLAESASDRAAELLETALEIPREPIQLAAANAILRRSATKGRMQLFRRLEELPTSVLEAVERAAPQLGSTFRQLLLQGNAETRPIALRVIRLTRQYLQVGHVIELMNRRESGDSEAAAATLRSLVNSLYDAWQGGAAGTGEGIAAQAAVRLQIVGVLEHAATNWESQAFPEDIVESILILSEPSVPAVKHVLWHGTGTCKEIAAQLLLNSRHPGVLRLMAESLTEQYPHPKVFQAIRTRHDPEFLAALLRVIGRRRSTRQLEHLRQIRDLEWLDPPFDVLASIPPALQPLLIAFVNATQVGRPLKAGVQEWMLRFGTSEAKRAATNGLTLLDDAVIQEVVRESLESDDAEVQAWATTRLRQHAVPESFALLIERLDSPLRSVQEAARSELAAFNVPRVLALADDLPPEDARRAGELLMKVDVDAAANLRRELSHPARHKRISSARAIARLGLQAQFLSAYALMAQDADPIARRTAAQVLATIPHIDAYRALLQMQDDPHPRVRETSAEALQCWNREPVTGAGNDADPTASGALVGNDW